MSTNHLLHTKSFLYLGGECFDDQVSMFSHLYSFCILCCSADVRRAYMIRNKHPGPYDDTVGPAVLGVMLMLSIVAQFAIKLYSMSV